MLASLNGIAIKSLFRSQIPGTVDRRIHLVVDVDYPEFMAIPIHSTNFSRQQMPEIFQGRHQVRSRIRLLIIRLSMWCMASGLFLASCNAQDSIDFAHDLFPILKARCGECHSNGVQKGGFSLETRQALLDSGAVESGSHEDSELFLRISTSDTELRMPPEGKALSTEQIELIGKWIDEGVKWPPELTLKESRFSRSLELDRRQWTQNQIDRVDTFDQVVGEYFKQHQLAEPDRLDDRLFLRRLKMDLLGLLPTVDEVNAFVNDTDPDKDKKWVDDFLGRDRDYADHWMSFWNDLLRNDYAGTGYIDGGRQQITAWLHRSLLENKPYDQFVKELINPLPEAAGFIRGIKWRGKVNASQIEPLQFSQNISQVFLGINMKCASCHDSFIDDWKLSDAYGLAAIISEKPLQLHRCDIPTGVMAESKFVFPELGEIDGTATRQKRLEQLAKLMTSTRNGRFSRTLVNRLWERMAGRGLVHPVDVMANQAWSEPLLDLLAIHLIENRYDMKRTLRLIASSKIYRSSTLPAGRESLNHEFVFRGISAKRLHAEQFVDAIWQLTEAGPEKPDAAIEFSETNPEAVPVRAALVQSNLLLRSLGRPNREQVVTTRPADLSTLQALDLSNGELLSAWIQQGASNWLTRQQQEGWTDHQLISQLFQAALSREPRESELKLLALDSQSEKRPQIEDIFWIVVMLPEFQLVE